MQPTSFKLFNSLLSHPKKKKKFKIKKTSHRKRGKKIHYQDHHHQAIENPNTTISAEIVCTNEDLMNIILSKLREKCRFKRTVVCKIWYKVITGNPFNLKLRPPSDLVIQRYTRRTGPALYPTIKHLTVKLDAERRPLPELPEPFLHFLEANDLLVNGIRISQSCNGLFLCPANILSCPHANSANVKHYVYNPTTNMTRLIPLPSNDHKRRYVTAMNLAFDPSNSPHYKVISLSRVDEDFFSYTRVDIYSSETHSWSESKADFPFPRNLTRVDFGKGVFLNDKIHWPSYKGDTSVYFDVGNECFKTMPMPEIQEGEKGRSIRFFGESGGRLILIDSHEPSPMKFDVLGMENDYSGWSVKYRVDFSYIRRISNKFHILSVICGADENDLLLVIYVPGRDKSGKGLMTYNLRNEELKKVNSPVPLWDLRLMEQKGFLVVHPLIRTRFAV